MSVTRAAAAVAHAAAASTRFGLSFTLALWLSCSFAAAAGARVSAWPLAWVTPIAFAVAVGGAPARRRALAAVAALATAAGAAVLARLFPECTWDGVLYHQAAVFALADGWNPWHHGADALPAYVPRELAAQVAGYPKAAWLVAAACYRATGDVAAANVLPWLVLLAPVAPAIAVARRRRRAAAHSLAVAVLAAANPVVVYQLTTSYVDGIVASLLTTLLLALRAHDQRPSRGWLALAVACAVLLAGVKLTGVVYAAVVLAVVAAAAWRRCGHRVAVWGAAGLLAGAAVAGDAYGRNWLVHGSPFHAARPTDASVLVNQANADFLARGRLARVALAWTSRADDDDVHAAPAARWPLTQWRWRHRYDPRFSGFGPLFFEALLLALVAWAARGPRLGRWAIAIVLSALATEAAWWARLAPQWWLLPLLPLLAARSSRRWGRWLELLLLVLLLVNVVLVAAPALRSARRLAAEWRHAAARTGAAPTITTYAGRPEHAAVIERRLAELRAR